MSPAPQLVWQVPALHTVPAAQAIPHVPQFDWSVVRSRQLPLQLVVPVAQVVWHRTDSTRKSLACGAIACDHSMSKASSTIQSS